MSTRSSKSISQSISQSTRNNDLNSIENIFFNQDLQSLTENLKSLIQHDAVIYNKSGVIIAASNTKRLGAFHPGVQGMLENDEEMIVVNDSDRPGNVLPGITLPIIFQQKPIGGVGLTGKPEDLKQFLKVIQFLVQRSLSDLSNEINAFNYSNEIAGFVYNWMLQTGDTYDDAFISRGEEMMIDIQSDRIVCALDSCISDDAVFSSKQLNTRILQYISKRLRRNDSQHLVAVIDNIIVMLLYTDSHDTALELISGIKKSLLKDYGVNTAIGMVNVACGHGDIKAAYDTALLAMEASRKSASHEIVSYDIYSVDHLMASVRNEYKKSFSDHVFKKYDNPEKLNDDILIINTYVETNRSIQKTSELLHMHKNTVQYKLNRISQTTGYDIHDLKDLLLIYLAGKLHE